MSTISFVSISNFLMIAFLLTSCKKETVEENTASFKSGKYILQKNYYQLLSNPDIALKRTSDTIEVSEDKKTVLFLYHFNECSACPEQRGQISFPVVQEKNSIKGQTVVLDKDKVWTIVLRAVDGGDYFSDSSLLDVELSSKSNTTVSGSANVPIVSRCLANKD